MNIRILTLLALLSAASSLLPANPIFTVEFFNQFGSPHTIAGGTLPFGGYIPWRATDGADATNGEGIRWLGVTCMDGQGDENECGLKQQGPDTLLSPITMRLTDMTFSCDNAEGCDPFEINLTADFTLVPDFDPQDFLTNFQVEGCTLNSPAAPGTRGSCDGQTGNNLTLSYFFSFLTTDTESANTFETSYGDLDNYLGVNGSFNFTGGGVTLPLDATNRRIIMNQVIRIGGLVSVDDFGQTTQGKWNGAIHFPGSISSSFSPTSQPPGGEIPEPATTALIGTGLAALASRRFRDSLCNHGRAGRNRAAR